MLPMRRNLPIFDERCLDDVGVAAPVTLGEFAARAVDVNSAHGLGGGGKELRAIFKLHAGGPDQS